MRRAPVAAATMVAVVVAGVAALAGWSLRAAGEPGGAALGPGTVTVEMGVEHSRFSVERLRVRPGTTVRFVLRNTDPIAHELIVGDDEVHRRHAGGTERAHPPVAGEVSVGPHGTASTLFTFEDPGTVVFACHLPGHREYGMEGAIEVAGR